MFNDFQYEIFLLGILAFLFRWIFVQTAEINFDTYGHLYFTSEVKAQKTGPFGAIKTKVFGSSDFYHPFLWHWLVSWFPIKSVLKKAKYINIVLDAFLAVCLYIFLTKAGFKPFEAIVGYFLYLFTPIFFTRLAMGPRVNSLTPRLFAEGLGFFMSILLIIGHGAFYEFWLIGLILVTMVLIISQKFGVQVAWFLLPILAVLTLDLTPLFILISSNLLAMVISRGQFLRALNRQMQHLSSYFIDHKKKKMAISNRNNLTWVSEWKKLGAKTIAKKLVIENSFTAVMLKFPMIVLYLFMLASDLANNGARPLSVAEALSISAIILFVFTSLPAFLPLGEAERYLLYVTPAIIFSSLQLALAEGYMVIIYCLLIWGACFWSLEIFLYTFRGQSSTREDAEKKILSFLNREAKPGGVLSIPYHAVGVYRVMLESERTVIYPPLMSKDKMNGFIERFGHRYPFIDLKKIDGLCKEYPIKYVIVDTNKVFSYDNLENASWRKLSKDFHPFVVFERLQ
jgi:hypothetical protein